MATAEKKTHIEKSHTDQSKKKNYMELRIPKITKANNLILFGLIILLIALSFVAGTLYTKVKYLEENGVTGGVAAAPANINEALTQYAKQLKLDNKKFQACLSDGKYTQRVTAQTDQGTQVGVQATPTFYINGKFVGGAYPLEAFKNVIDKELDGTGSENAADYIEILQQAYENEMNRSFDPAPKQVDIGDAPVRGDRNAKVTIVEFSDFQCPFCKQAVSTLDQVLEEYKGKVRLVYKHYPITSIHPNAQIAAEASECAREQNKFWEYHDLLFAQQTAWANLPQAATTTP